MAKNKQHRALLEVLLKNHGYEPPKPTVQARPAETAPPPPRGVEPKPAGPLPLKPVDVQAGGPRREAPAKGALGGSAESIFARGRVVMTYYQLLVCVVFGVVLCGVCFFLGRFLAPVSGEPAVPRTQAEPTREQIQKQPVTPGLVKRGPEETAVGGEEHPGDATQPRPPAGKGAPVPVGEPEKADSGTERSAAGGAEEAGDPNGKMRLRITQLRNTDSAKTDRLRTFLAQNGVETDLVARGGFQFLYSHARFLNDAETKAKAFKDKVVKLLKDFKKQTGIQVSTDAFFVAVE